LRSAVEAADEQEAVEKAVTQFNVSAALKSRLVARKAG
jgi:hypothetical protein